MRRLPVAAFAALVAATVGAFFLTQHLKVRNPYINGAPRADPPAINPIAGRVCKDILGKRVSYRTTRVGFYLQSHADTVDVYVVNSDGVGIATARGSGRYVETNHRVAFSWNGRESDGRVAPDGTYHFRVQLQSEDVSFDIAAPIQVITRAPRPEVTSVALAGAATRPAAAAVPVISPLVKGETVTIHFTPGNYRDSRILVYRTDLPGGPRLVYAFGANGAFGVTGWNGRIGDVAAPQGTYLIGIRVTDEACNVGTFPVVDPPPPGSTPHAGVTVRYLAAEPPASPTPAGSDATVLVDSRRQPYSWTLRAGSATKVLERGTVSSASAASGAGVALRVPIPGRAPDVYELTLRSGGHRTTVPLVASDSAPARAASAAPPPVLVVLPALTWQGENPVDDTGDGLPDTLAAGDQIDLDRPLVDGLPPNIPDELGLLGFLGSQHDSFQLTTDTALAEGVGPTLSGVDGVILDGALQWLPSSLAASLRMFAQDGGRVLALGTDSLQALAPIRVLRAGKARVPVAGPPTPLSPDPFGARHGAIVGHTTALIIPLVDRLRIFGNIPALPGFTAYQEITPPASAVSSEAGIAVGAPAIAGFRLGRGVVVEVGLPGFGTSLAHNVDAQELAGNLWKLISS